MWVPEALQLDLAAVVAVFAGGAGHAEQRGPAAPGARRLRAVDVPGGRVDVEVVVGTRGAGGRPRAAEDGRPTAATAAAGAPVVGSEVGVDPERDQRGGLGCGRVELLDLEPGALAAGDQEKIARLRRDGGLRAEWGTHGSLLGRVSRRCARRCGGRCRSRGQRRPRGRRSSCRRTPATPRRA